ncbi:MAG TPA: PqqD family protein, partial [Candidatus Polarisedimenticolia bacterium]|nr:PqqD family protein [Candidatus Polarisedimenticolia bacterium]
MSSHPRLVRGVTLTRRQIGPDEVFYLVKDPNKGIYLRMGEVEAAILKLLDGSRASPELSRILHDTHGHEVDPSAIDEFLELLARRGLVQSRVFDPAAFRREW